MYWILILVDANAEKNENQLRLGCGHKIYDVHTPMRHRAKILRTIRDIQLQNE
jgi:hypothetical protein